MFIFQKQILTLVTLREPIRRKKRLSYGHLPLRGRPLGLILVTKKGKNKTFQKHLKWPYLKVKASLREAIKKKGGLLMEIFHKGSDPPPLFSGVMEPVLHI